MIVPMATTIAAAVPAVRVRVPLEVALVIIAVLVVLFLVFGAGKLASWLERKLPSGLVRWGSRGFALGCIAAAVVLVSIFFPMQDQYHPVYRGRALFDLGEVILAASLLAAAALAFSWSRWKLSAALLALLGGAAIFAKPFVKPLMHFPREPSGMPGTPEDNPLAALLAKNAPPGMPPELAGLLKGLGAPAARPEPYGLTSETHLYFLLSGAGLFVLGVILIVHWRLAAGRDHPAHPRKLSP